MIKLEKILSDIRNFYFQYELIKVVKGFLRSGKTMLLEQITDELLENNVAVHSIM